MSTYLEAPVETERRPLSIAITVARLALIGVALVVVAGAFAYLGGWLSPNNLTPARFTDAFERVDGVHAGFRRNHAKGVGVSGFFESNGNGVRFSKAVVFRPGRVPVVGRFSFCPAASRTSPTAPMRCAASGFNSICRTAKCGEPR